MSRTLEDLFSREALEHAVTNGLVVRRCHRDGRLTLYNYTERCQYERGLWSNVTRTCRGLIVADNGAIVARPFSKFFNYGQDEGGEFDPTAPVVVADKLDGSLGILYHDGTRLAIATRGAFESDQAIHATEILRRNYAAFQPPAGWTVLFEIIYPENRIVVEYGGMDDLVLLGAVEIETGVSVGPNDDQLSHWIGPKAEVFPFATLADALAAPSRANREGLVVTFDDGRRLKIKQEDYVALHRLIMGLNKRMVWEHAMNGGTLDALLSPLPDEFHPWTRSVFDQLVADLASLCAEVETAYAAAVARLPEMPPRKDFAMLVKDSPLSAMLFARHDGKEYAPMIWRGLRPEGNQGPRGTIPMESP